jgi:penicillin-binding protein 2
MAADKRATRLGVLALVGALLFSLVGVRLWFVQTVQQESLQREVNTTKLRTVPLLPERGRIFDANGRIMADNKRVLTVAVDWPVLRKKSDRLEIFRRLSGWVDVPVETMEARFESGVDSPFLPMPVAEDVDERTATAIQERVEDLPGVSIIEQSRRVYPYAPLASHVVGYMGRITPETKDIYTKAGYNLNERVGQFGIELSMEKELHGKWGSVTYEVDNANRIVREVKRVPPINGNDIQLTIDLDQQQFAEQTLETELMARRAQTATNPKDSATQFTTLVFPDYPDKVPFKAPAGSVVVQNYQNGQIIALASYPTFDNRWFEANLSKDKFEQLFPSKDPVTGKAADPDQSILVNRAIQGRYNLGSTFKPFTAYSAMITGLIGPNDYYQDVGKYEMESVAKDKCKTGLVRCVYRNATCIGTLRPCVYGNVDVETALAVSSDSFFYRLGELLMTRNNYQPVLQEQVRKFGFGARTGIDLPFEFSGVVPDAAVKKQYADLGVITKDEGQGYFTGDNVQLAIGQGLLSASPLQLAVGYSTIANGGFVMKPEIIKAIYEPGVPDSTTAGVADLTQARLAQPAKPNGTVIRQIPMPADIHDEIDRGLHRVIYGPGTNSDQYHATTGESLFYVYPKNDIPLAGKTGTAQGTGNYPWTDSSVFASYSDDPTRPYTVTAYLEKSGYGSKAAAPVAKCMFMQMSGSVQSDPVVLSDQLDLNSTVAAPPRQLRDPSCLNGRFVDAKSIE